MRKRILTVLCLANLIGLLIFGLWPFHHPKSQVAWVPGRTGLHLGNRSTVRSEVPLSVRDEADISIELWLQPEEDDVGTIVSFYDPSDRLSFSLRDELSDLILQKRREEPLKTTPVEKVSLYRLLPANKATFLTVTSEPGSTTLYANGEPVRTLAGFSVAGRDLSRILLVGDSTGQADGWVGEFRGFAIYEKVLTAAEARANYVSWLHAGGPDITKPPRPVALYRFDERLGPVAHSTGSTQVELSIPAQYSILDKTLLEMPWNAFRPHWDYWQDIAINIGGFIPLGFFAAAYLSPAPLRRAAILAVALGAAISLTIESLQWFLPTRDSDMTDVLTNTLGTWIGVALLRRAVARRVLNYFLDLCESLARPFSADATN